MIEADGVTKRYGTTLAVDDLSFTVPTASSPASSGPTAPASPRPCG